MHICKFVLDTVFDKEDGGRDSLFLCNAGDNAIMVSGVVLDISKNPADANRDRFPDSVPITEPTPVAPPTADFTATPTDGAAPLTTQLTDTSTGSPTSWAWDFGDGTTDTAQNPTHDFAAAGSYAVVLTATNAGGSSTSAATTITVT